MQIILYQLKMEMLVLQKIQTNKLLNKNKLLSKNNIIIEIKLKIK
jgi:hypothetical protein